MSTPSIPPGVTRSEAPPLHAINVHLADGEALVRGAVTASLTSSERHVRDAIDRDSATQPIDQLEQRVRPSGETIVYLATEPSKFTLADTARLRDTTNNGHLVLLEKIRLSSQSDQVAASRQSPNRGITPAQTKNPKLRC